MRSIEILVHADKSFISIGLAKTATGDRVSVGYVGVLGFTVSTLNTGNTLVTFRALQAHETSVTTFALVTFRTGIAFGAVSAV